MLGDDIVHALPDLRRQALSVMRDVAEVRAAGESVFDPATGTNTSVPTVVLTSVARLRQPSLSETNALFGGEDVTKTRFMVSMPHDVAGVELEHTIVFTESDDPSALDREFRVVAVPSMSFPVLRDFACEATE